jgi:transposase
METTPEQFATIEHCLPRQRGHVSLSNLQVVNASLYVAEHGCKWHGLPKRFGTWHTAYSTPWRTRFHADGGQCSIVMPDTDPR